MEAGSIRRADQYQYDNLMADNSDGGDGGDEGVSERRTCCNLICGVPAPDEAKVNCFCFRISKRVIKNVLMFVIVLAIYMMFL